MKGQLQRYPVKGMDDGLLAQPDTAALLRDVELDNTGAWQAVPGTQDITTFSSSPVTALTVFNPRGGQRWWVVERKSTEEVSQIAYADFLSTGGARGRAVQITTRRRLDSVQLGTQFLEHGGWLYMLSPLDALIRWNGFFTGPVGFARPAPPPRVVGPDQGFDFVDKAGGNPAYATFNIKTQRGVGPTPNGSDVNWLYGYALTVVNNLGQESPPSPIVYVSGTNENAAGKGKKVVRVMTPRQDSGIRGVRLWRTINIKGSATPDNNVNLQLLAEFGSGAPVEYIDTASDAELGVLLDPDQTGPVPQGARAMAFWGGGMWLGGHDDGTRVAYSAPGKVEQFPAINFIPVGTSATGRIVALVPMLRGLAVFKTGGVYVIKGDYSSGFHVETVSEIEGCAAPAAVVHVPGTGVFFLAGSGPRLLVGSLNDEQPTSVQIVGREILKFWRRRVAPVLWGARAVYDPERKEVWFAVPEGGDPDPRSGIVCHIGSGAWSVRQGWNVGAFCHYRGRTYLTSWAAAGIHVLTRAVRTKFGTAIAPYVRTNLIVFDPDPKHVHTVQFRLVAYGQSADDKLSLSTRTDGTTAVAQQQGWPTLRTMIDAPLWGVATWDPTAVWSDYEMELFPLSVQVPMARFLELTATFGPRFRMIDVAVVVGSTDGPQQRERSS
ncbi:MAG TPA: hypothetical protein VI792_03265 [Candidatus Eisenbacteria bacterium]